MTKRLAQTFYLLLTIEALSTVIWLAAIPSDPKNALFLGLSASRLALMLVSVAIGVMAVWALWRFPTRLHAWLDKWLSTPPGFFMALLILSGALFAGWHIYRSYITEPTPVLLRLTPILLLIFLSIVQAFAMLVLPQARNAIKTTFQKTAGGWRAWRAMPRKEKVFTLIGTALVLLVTMFMLEVFLRIFLPQPTYSTLEQLAGSFYTNSDFNPFTLKANDTSSAPSQEYPGEFVEYNINSVGLRGEEISAEKNTQRILVLGDSYTFGVFVEDHETYAAVLEQLYTEEGKKIEVLNAGYANGWEPDEQYAWLVNRGLQFEPDLIIYGFYAGNDISGLYDEYWVERDERELPTKIDDTRFYVDEWGHVISLKSNPYSSGFDLIYRLPVIRESHAIIFLANSIEGTLLSFRTRERNEYGHFPFILLPESDALMQHQEDLFLSLVEGMHAVAENNGAEFVVAMLPTNFQVEPDFLPVVYGPRYRVERNYYAEIAPTFDALGINYIDILELMTANPGHYFPDNGEVHFNPEGHRFTAEQIKLYLDELGIP